MPLDHQHGCTHVGKNDRLSVYHQPWQSAAVVRQSNELSAIIWTASLCIVQRRPFGIGVKCTLPLAGAAGWHAKYLSLLGHLHCAAVKFQFSSFDGSVWFCSIFAGWWPDLANCFKHTPGVTVIKWEPEQMSPFYTRRTTMCLKACVWFPSGFAVEYTIWPKDSGYSSSWRWRLPTAEIKYAMQLADPTRRCNLVREFFLSVTWTWSQKSSHKLVHRVWTHKKRHLKSKLNQNLHLSGPDKPV